MDQLCGTGREAVSQRSPSRPNGETSREHRRTRRVAHRRHGVRNHRTHMGGLIRCRSMRSDRRNAPDRDGRERPTPFADRQAITPGRTGQWASATSTTRPSRPRCFAPRFANAWPILDVDVHHGNGTQDIFYERDDIFFASIHGDPSNYYPFYWGYPDQTGAGPGSWSDPQRASYPVRFKRTARSWPPSRALEGVRALRAGRSRAVARNRRSVHDVHGRHKVTDEGFGRMAERIAALRLPTVDSSGGRIRFVRTRPAGGRHPW